MSNEPARGLLDGELARARSGDRAAFAVLVRAHQRSVYSLALRMLGNREMAEDLTQDVFMQLSGNFPVIESSQHLAFWLRKVTANRAIDQLRQQRRVELTMIDAEAELFSTEQGEDPLLQRHLRALLTQLSPAARAVLLLKYQEDLDPTEIARTLNMPINTVKSHLKRSLQQLRENTPGAQPASVDRPMYE